MSQLRLDRLALVCAAAAVAACSGGNRDTAADSASMAPAGGVTTDTGAMGGAAGTGGATGTAADSTNAGTAGVAGGTGGTGATGGTAAGTGTPTNQTQSGVTNAKTGASTLGSGVKQIDSTAGARRRP